MKYNFKKQGLKLISDLLDALHFRWGLKCCFARALDYDTSGMVHH